MNLRMAAAAACTLGLLPAVSALGQSDRRGDPEARKAGPTHSLMVNGRPVAPDVEPQMVRGRMMVPIRFVAEALGANVTWDPRTRVVRLLQGDDEIRMTVGSTQAYVKGFGRALAVPPIVRDGRTLVPLRAVARFTGGFATYNPRNRTVFVSTGGGPGNPEARVLGGGL